VKASCSLLRLEIVTLQHSSDPDRGGVPERVAMAITGHKTRSVFDRYHIVSEPDLRQASSRLAQYVEGLKAAQNRLGVRPSRPFRGRGPRQKGGTQTTRTEPGHSGSWASCGSGCK